MTYFTRDDVMKTAYEGVTHAGLAILSPDGQQVLLAERAYDETDLPEVQGKWEIPGGALLEGEEPVEGAIREFTEEIGFAPPLAETLHGWRSDGEGENPDGHYQGFVVRAAHDIDIEQFEPTKEVSAIEWFDATRVEEFAAEGFLRPEVASMDWVIIWGAASEEAVSGNEGEMDDEQMAEDDTDFSQVFAQPIPVHGVLAPEEIPTGDGRGFEKGSMTTRGYRLPFRWQESDIGGHDGASTLGSVDRMMRKDGLIHWDGLLMPMTKTDEFVDLLAFFGQYGVSVDADKGGLNQERSQAEGMAWFQAVRAAGLTAVAIPAFSEAYVALGPHPDMPAEEDEEAALVASGDLTTFKRGKGWVTNPTETRRLHRYWTEKGQPGYAKVGWGTPGDFTRAKALIGEKIAKNSPEKMRFLNQIIAQWHFDALGYWPGELGKPGNAPDTPENRRRAARHARGAGARGTEASAGAQWETVLTSAGGERLLPPAVYFTEHPETGALVVEEPDENGIRRVHGYAAEWGVCHIGYGNRCVEPPEDPDGGEFRSFHLGRTKTDEGYINTGLLTYNVSHRDAETLLSESAEQAHFDNLRNAWAAVRIGTNERGIWMSGVVLPDVPEDDLVKIEASGQVSGEWVRGALRGLLTVNIPGFPVMRSSAAYDDEGNVIALAASAFASAVEVNGVQASPCASEDAQAGDDPVGDLALAVMDRIEGRKVMDALREREARRRFDQAKANWAGGWS